MSRSRSLTPEENQRVCDAVRGLLDEYDSQGELSAAILLPEGKAVSQQSVSNALANKTVGLTFARAVAMRMGISLEELISGNRGNRGAVQRYHELPGWQEAAEQVLDEEMAPPYAVAEAGKGLVSYPVKRVDETLVYDEAMRWMKHAPFEVRKAAEKAEVQAVLAREARAAKRRVLAGSDELPAGLDEAGEIQAVPWVPTGRRKA
jgi:hypothetical protein